MRLCQLRTVAQEALDEQGYLTDADWLWILGELMLLDDREADGLFGVIEVQGRRVEAWWSC